MSARGWRSGLASSQWRYNESTEFWLYCSFFFFIFLYYYLYRYIFEMQFRFNS
jgi:hypothetical protein